MHHTEFAHRAEIWSRCVWIRRPPPAVICPTFININCTVTICLHSAGITDSSLVQFLVRSEAIHNHIKYTIML